MNDYFRAAKNYIDVICFSSTFIISDFTKCCKDSGILMVVKCRKENSALKECLTA